ncbi:MAG TPA: hypothetical protein DGG95_07270 [Cytophagales bacterium]|jgi:hypothetical protein|nr:hypothetical protein [Cytophagales bacterium]
MTEKNWFNEDGDLEEWVTEKLNAEGKLTGSDAVAYLAEEFAGCTHGNYVASTFFTRVSNLNVTVTR